MKLDIEKQGEKAKKLVERTYSVKELCERFGCGEHTIYHWLASGELGGINTSRKLGGRPKWRITQSSLATFETARANVAPPPAVNRRRKSTSAGPY